MKNHSTIATVLALAVILPGAALMAQDTGTADFTRYVALGDSLTAGFSNNSLIYTHQAASLGRLLHIQTGAGGTFEQPYVSPPGLRNELFLLSLGDPLIIAPFPGEIAWPSWEFNPQDPDYGSFPNFYLGQPLGYLPYDNLGIPGMGASDALSTTCDGPLEDLTSSPFYCTILRNPECEDVFNDPAAGTCGASTADSKSALEQALFSVPELGITQPTFMTVWLGSADVLGAVISGVVIENVTITPLPEFSSAFSDIIEQISDEGIQMAIANVPDATNTPWATTIPPFLVDPLTGAPVLDDGGELVFLLGTDESGTQRTLTIDDKVILPASSLLSDGVGIPVIYDGTGEYLPDDVILDETELGVIQTRIDGFNALIATEAQDAGAAFVDAYARMNQIIDDGVLLGGLTFTDDFLTGGLFGYDGIHPTNLGYGIVTQWFVDAINQTYGGSIPPVDLGPLVFGSIPQPSSLGDIIFGSQAQSAVLASMGLPDSATLQEIKERMRRDRTSPRQRSVGDRRDVLERRIRGR
jgi:lysophospholipase L1-like esterase